MQRIESKRHAPQGKATRQTAVPTAVFRGVFTSTAVHRTASQGIAAHGKANRVGHWQQWLSRCVFTSHALQCKARQRTALAEPEQSDPVAWMVMNGVVNYQLIGSKSAAYALAIEMQKRHDLSGSIAAFHVQPLYAAPPRREPLSEDLILDLTRDKAANFRWPSSAVEIARAIEQAITGEKT